MDGFPSFFGSPPNYQNAFSLFSGEWSTRLPDACGWVASTGPGRFCEDYRIAWASERLAGFAGKSILELGPLEGGHSVMLERMGASQVLAIEANSKAFLKCLIMKEAFGLTRVRYLLGDFQPYLATSAETFDAAIACGVLYHLMDPVAAIELLTRHANELVVWTHYYDEAFFASARGAGHSFLAPARETCSGFAYTRHVRHYGEALQWGGFCGGGANQACWLSRSDLLGALAHFGFEIVDSVAEENPHGPALLFVAKRKGHELAPREMFPEQAYLDRYPDVKAAILAGHFRSGEHHYAVCGTYEGRIR